MTKKITDKDLENLSAGAVDVQIVLTGKEKVQGPPPTQTPANQFGGNLMQNTEQDHDADGR